MNQETELWEILVPKAFNDGKEVELSHHQKWDEEVRKIAGGLTILKSAKGQWVDPKGELFSEKMIPVRVACDEEQMRKLIDFTLKHYDQEAVMAYLVSRLVIVVYRGQ